MKINPIQLQKHLKGVTYPASKQDLLQKAESNGVDDNVRSVLQALPEQEYGKPTDVTAAVKNLDNK
ncbi:DUF2795 domain-containing protein [Deinococcus pimensis]|uniref:DUF2795 domain-containing protein n=1 Tax=Deinococcus pimensis TaxID=309888 RepID=UPI0004B11501|nr:DUF2795 domain-containing protein [Deinococcus pimensis]